MRKIYKSREERVEVYRDTSGSRVCPYKQHLSMHAMVVIRGECILALSMLTCRSRCVHIRIVTVEFSNRVEYCIATVVFWES